MMESRKVASVTRYMSDENGEHEIGMTMFGSHTEIPEEVLQCGMDIGLTIAPLLFKCACRHLDEFEDERIRELIRNIADEC